MRARERTRPPARAIARGRRAPDRSACLPRRPCPAVLPSSRGAPFDVEDVVDDLKREAELGRVAIDRRAPRRSSAPAMIAPADADARISAPVLRACIARRPSASSVDARPGACPAACRSIAWPPTMPRRRPRRRRCCERRAASARPAPDPCAGRLARQQRERFGLQAVAGENRHAFAEHDVERRPPASQRVVVHRRQIVVDERIRVDHLDRARGGQRELAAASSAQVRTSRTPPATRPRRSAASDAAACRRQTRCTASRRSRRRDTRAASASTARAPRRFRRARERGRRTAARSATRRVSAAGRRRRARRARASAHRAPSVSRCGAPPLRAVRGRSATAGRRVRRARATARAARSPSSSFLTIDSSSAIAASKSLIDVSTTYNLPTMEDTEDTEAST